MSSKSFEPGAPAASGQIALCVPNVGSAELAYLRECIETNFVSSVGPFVERFERHAAEVTGLPFGIATASGTAALHVALLVAGVEPDDEVLVSDLTFIAPVNAIRYVGAWPVLVDAEPGTWQMDVSRVEDFLVRGCKRKDGLLRNRVTGRRVSAIVPVHILGHPVDMMPLLALAERFGLAVVEDATESLGARYRGAPVGSHAGIACYSFNGNKLLTSGGGGAIVTSNSEWAAKARYLTTQAKDDAVEFVHGAVGFNYRLTNIQAAVGCAQFERLEEFLAAKQRIAARYEAMCAALPGVEPMPEAEWADSAKWLYTIRLDPSRFPEGSRPLMAALAAEGIQARPLWQPIHRSPAHRGAHALGGEVADALQRQCLSLPSSTGLTQDEQERVVETVSRMVESHSPAARRA
jgi:perosamine synthetase